MRKIVSSIVLCLMFASLIVAASVCVTPSVSVDPNPIAVNSPTTITQILTNSCNGHEKVTFWTNVESPCAGNATIEFQNVTVNGSATFNDQFTPPCADTYTVTTTVESSPHEFTSAIATFVAQ